MGILNKNAFPEITLTAERAIPIPTNKTHGARPLQKSIASTTPWIYSTKNNHRNSY
jgi:hypothetical protein